MTNKRSIFVLILCLLSLGCEAVAASTPPSPTVTVTDNNLPEPMFIHWSQFGTTLSATVNNPPQSTQETTITGPHYKWTCSNPGPGFAMSGEDSASNTLKSTSNQELVAGNNDVTVYCTVTYTSTDNKTGTATTLSFSGNTDVLFFVRVPNRVVQISNINHSGPPYPGMTSPYSTPGTYGHIQDYHLQMQDNQPSPQPYKSGTAVEEFVAGTIQNGPPPPTVGPNPNGSNPPANWPCSDFVDYIEFVVNQNMAQNYGWSVTTLVISFDQRFHCVEQTDRTLNTFHINNDYQTATRTPKN